MLDSRKEILSNIDETLDQLIANAELLTEIAHEAELTSEREALEALQESLLSHLLSMDELLQVEKTKTKPSTITAKFEKLDALRLKKRKLVRR